MDSQEREAFRRLMIEAAVYDDAAWERERMLRLNRRESLEEFELVIRQEIQKAFCLTNEDMMEVVERRAQSE